MGRSVLAYEAEGESCRVMAVIGGDDVLGSTALFHRAELDDISIRTFERSSSIIGIVLLSQERMEATKSRGASTLLRSLVSPRQDEPALMANQAERHGLDLGPAALADADRDGRPERRLRGAPLQDLDAARERAGRRDRRRSRRAVRRDAGDRGAADDLELGPARLGHRPSRRAVTAGVRAGRDPRAVRDPQARAAGAAPDRRERPVVGQNELALYSTLFETHDQASLTAFLDATIGALISHDRKRTSELATTLLTYFDSNQNAKLTAQRLQIHVNTVRQRLATIEDLLGHWGNASRALEIHIALRLWSLGSTAE